MKSTATYAAFLTNYSLYKSVAVLISSSQMVPRWSPDPQMVPGAVEQEVPLLLGQKAHQAPRVRQHRQHQARRSSEDHQEKAWPGGVAFRTAMGMDLP